MRKNGFLGIIYTIMEWITRIAFVNLLWVGFSVFGLIIFGIGPATASMYAITRKWVMGRSDVKIFPLFWHTFRTEFFQSNLLFWSLAVAGYIIYIDYQYVSNFQGTVYFILLFLLVNITVIYIIVALYIFPVFVQFQYRTLHYFKHALMIGITNPFNTLIMLASILIIGLIMERVPGLIPFFPACLLSFILMALGYRAFNRVGKKHKNLPI